MMRKKSESVFVVAGSKTALGPWSLHCVYCCSGVVAVDCLGICIHQ